MRPMIHRNAWLPTVFNSLFDADLMPRTAATAPAINVLESDKDYTVSSTTRSMSRRSFCPTMWRRIQFQLVWRTVCSPSSCPRCSRPSRKRVARLR